MGFLKCFSKKLIYDIKKDVFRMKNVKFPTCELPDRSSIHKPHLSRPHFKLRKPRLHMPQIDWDEIKDGIMEAIIVFLAVILIITPVIVPLLYFTVVENLVGMICSFAWFFVYIYLFVRLMAAYDWCQAKRPWERALNRVPTEKVKM